MLCNKSQWSTPAVQNRIFLMLIHLVNIVKSVPKQNLSWAKNILSGLGILKHNREFESGEWEHELMFNEPQFWTKRHWSVTKVVASILPLLPLTSDLVNPATLHYPQQRQGKLQLVAALTPISTGMIPSHGWLAWFILALINMEIDQQLTISLQIFAVLDCFKFHS